MRRLEGQARDRDGRRQRNRSRERDPLRARGRVRAGRGTRAEHEGDRRADTRRGRRARSAWSPTPPSRPTSRRWCSAASAELGGLEIFFANIGVTGTNTPLLEQTVEEWEEVYRINTISCFLAIKYAGRHMTAQRYGSIILTSSAASLRANAGAISYSASKAAVNNLAQTAANAFAGTGVRVNAVLPGLVETQLTRKVFEDARARGVEGKLGHVTPMKRPGRADEIAAAAAFLASDNSSYVDGQLLSVDGGVSSTHPYGRIALPN